MCFGGVGSSDFSDFSLSPKNISVVGSVKISGDQSKYYGRSAYFPGTASYLRTTSLVDLFFGLGDFAIECYAWRSSAPSGVAMLFHIVSTYGFNLEWRADNKIGLYLHGGTTTYNIGINTLTLSAWNHIVLKRESGVFAVILNGALQFSRSVSKSMPTAIFYIGHDSAVSDRDYGPGYMCGVRVTNGSGRYPDTFSNTPGMLVTPVFPDYSPPLISIGSNFSVIGGGSGDYVGIYDANDNSAKAYEATPNSSGDWTIDITTGSYYIGFYAAGYPSQISGPHTVSSGGVSPAIPDVVLGSSSGTAKTVGYAF